MATTNDRPDVGDAALVRMEHVVTVPKDAQREIVRLLYVATRHQVKALTACLELEGLE